MATFIRQCVSGSGRVANWLTEAKAGLCGLDFVLIGDSNIGYGEAVSASDADIGARTYGLVDGLQKACVLAGINQYASPLYNFSRGGPSFYEGVGCRNSAGSIGVSGTNLQNATPATVGILGTAASANTAFNFFYQEMSGDVLTNVSSSTTGFVSSHNTTANWHLITTSLNYIGTGTNYRSDTLTLDAEPWLNEKTVSYYRVTHSFTTSGGSCDSSMQINGSIAFISPTFIQAGNGGVPIDPSFRDSEYLLFRTGGTHTAPLHIRCGGFYNTLTAPVAFFFHSVYEKRVGVACTPLYFESGAKLEDIRNKFITVSTATTGTVPQTQSGKYVCNFMKALVRRQEAASTKNKGRVCVVIQGGTNQSTEGTGSTGRASAVLAQMKSIAKTVTEQWELAGLSSGNLAFVFLSSPITTNAEMPELSRTLFSRGGTTAITAVEHMASLPSTEYVSNTYWDGAGTVGQGSSSAASPLTDAGYIAWGTAVVSNLLKYMPKLLHQKK